MYIVVIGWAYVTLMMAIAEDSAVAGVMTFLVYGALPIAIIIYLSGSKERRRRRSARQEPQHTSEDTRGQDQPKA